MAKQVRLDSRSAREKLKPRGAPYWAEAGAKVDLGYRRLKAGVGSWAMRRYVEETRTYVATTFARADDLDEADGVDILNYHEAQAKARELAAAAAEEERLASLGPPLTVARAVEEYVEAREQRWDVLRHRRILRGARDQPFRTLRPVASSHQPQGHQARKVGEDLS